MSATIEKMNAFGRRRSAGKIRRTRRLAVMLLGFALMTALAAPGAVAEPAQRTTTGVVWFGQSGRGLVADASASLVRTSSGVSASLSTNGLQPDHAYTLWIAVVDNPAACPTNPCSPAVVNLDSEVEGQTTYGGGHVVGASGRAGFAVHIPVGPIDGWLPHRVFDNPMGAEVHLILNDHGPKLNDYMPDMIQTYRGGCSDDSPFLPFFPSTALADGEPGPNVCLLSQVAVFLP